MVPVNYALLASCLLASLTLGFFAFPAAADPPAEKVPDRVYDDQGRLVWEFGESSKNPDLAFARHYTHRPGHGGGGGSLTDCPATQYALGGWHWNQPYSAKASSYASLVDASAATWDAITGATLVGTITAGSDGTAGVQDFKNQLDWVDLGASTTIAVTTTWYYRSTGEAVESDGQYNTHYAWSTTGEANAMDVQNIATHEIGHTFGLTHPNGNPNKIRCLTMYAYADYGETQKRTLGDGDILGTRALYGV